MAKFILSSILLTATCLALVADAGVVEFFKWKDIENRLARSKDHDGHTLVRWFHLDFKDKDISGLKKGLHLRLAIVSKFLSVSLPTDCDEEHLATIDEVESGAKVAKNLRTVFQAKLNDYVRLCQLNFGPKYEALVANLDPAQMEPIHRLANNIERRFGEGVNYASSRLLDENIESLYERDDRKFEGVNVEALRSACDSYIQTIGEFYKPLKTLRTHPNNDFTKQMTPFNIEEFKQAKRGYLELILCKVHSTHKPSTSEE